jgi:phosphoribosylaminoimidazolecarboxamide formyltransferase/IMP cyclohydrolase
MHKKRIKTALVSVFHKEGLDNIIQLLKKENITFISTGGTAAYLKELGAEVEAVENLTSYPSILGGRVKTLHPKIFGGILSRSENESDKKELQDYEIPEIDLVIVDLYPFEETVASKATTEEIIEKIDIGGISLIRAAAKNFRDVLIVGSKNQYEQFEKLLQSNGPESNLEERRFFAAEAFNTSSHYDTQIFNYISEGTVVEAFKASHTNKKQLRYGENPHQQAAFYGKLDEILNQIHGKEVSYNNLVDIESAVNLIEEFNENETVFAILKHTNACGCAIGQSVADAYERAFAADTISAFGGILVTNKPIDSEAAAKIHNLFFEVLIAPSFASDALDILKKKKNRILLEKKQNLQGDLRFKSLLNGVIVQDKDDHSDQRQDLKVSTKVAPQEAAIDDLLFASKVCKHTKSNTIVLAKNGQMLASGVGQTSRVDALEQAIKKAVKFGFDLNGSVMASDAFFPFPDCVEIAHQAGIKAVIQPGGSIKDQDSIDYCDQHGMAMVITGYRHFLH